MPAIKSVYRSYKDVGLVVIGLNLTAQDSKQDAALFAQEVGVTFHRARPGQLSRQSVSSDRPAYLIFC